MKTSISISLLNARSVRNKTSDIASILLSNDFDLFFLTETWLKHDSNENYLLRQCCSNLEIYDTFSQPRNYSNGGGIALICRCDFKVNQLSSLNQAEIELKVLEISFPTCRILFIICYRPPCGDFLIFKEQLYNIIYEFSTDYDLCVILGDFNVHFFNNKDNRYLLLQDVFQEFGLKQIINEPTHCAGNILDLVAITDEIKISQLNVIPFEVSDHHVISFLLPISVSMAERILKPYRKWDNIDLIELAGEIESNLLINQISFEENNTAMKDFSDIVAEVTIDINPTKFRLFRKRNCKFFDHDLQTMKQKRRKFERIFNKVPSLENRLTLKNANLDCRKLFKEKQFDYYNREVNRIKSQPKSSYSSFNEVLGIDTRSVLPNNCSLSDLADKFNTFFIEKIESVIASLKPHNFYYRDSNETLARDKVKFSSFNKVTCDDIYKAIASMSNATSPCDSMPTEIMKKIQKSWVPTFTGILNNCLQKGHFPNVFKLGIISPFLKKATLDRNLLSSYRPVTQLSFSSKIFERVISIQLLHLLNKLDILDPYQSAYRKGYSTELALLNTSNDILNKLSSKCPVILVALDLSAAFDTVSHDILLRRLENYTGLEGAALELCKSYLCGRYQAVKISSWLSSTESVKNGVPQGSILGPLFFSIYLLPLRSLFLSLDLNYQIYADDGLIYLSAADLNSSVDHLNASLVKITKLFEMNNLKINSDKTEVLFVDRKVAREINIRVNNEIVKSEDTLTVLGFIFDSKFNLQRQINSVCSSAYYILRKLFSIKAFLSFETRHLLCQSLILSRLDYCNSLYFGLPNYLLMKLQKIQNSAGRFVFQLKKGTPTSPYLHDLHWLPVSKRIEFKLLCIVFKVLNRNYLCPAFLRDILKLKQNSYSLRDGPKLVVPRVNSSLGRRSFSYCGAKLWNSLPQKMREETDFQLFRKSLKTHLFRSHYYTSATY